MSDQEKKTLLKISRIRNLHSKSIKSTPTIQKLPTMVYVARNKKYKLAENFNNKNIR